MGWQKLMMPQSQKRCNITWRMHAQQGVKHLVLSVCLRLSSSSQISLIILTRMKFVRVAAVAYSAACACIGLLFVQ